MPTRIYPWGLAFRSGAQGIPLTVSSSCAVLVFAWTLVYFRPTIERFLQDGGGNVPWRTLAAKGARPQESFQADPKETADQEPRRLLIIGNPCRFRTPSSAR